MTYKDFIFCIYTLKWCPLKDANTLHFHFVSAWAWRRAYWRHGTWSVTSGYSSCWRGPCKYSSITSIHMLFSAPEPQAQVHYCNRALSVFRLSVINFSHFRPLLWNRWTEFNKTWQEARSQRPLPSLSFSGRLEKQDGHHVLWLAETFSISPLKLLNRIQRNLTGSKISMFSTNFVFFRPMSKQKLPP